MKTLQLTMSATAFITEVWNLEVPDDFDATDQDAVMDAFMAQDSSTTLVRDYVTGGEHDRELIDYQEV